MDAARCMAAQARPPAGIYANYYWLELEHAVNFNSRKAFAEVTLWRLHTDTD